jgi:hypothetical protein
MKTLDQERALLKQPLLQSVQQTTPYRLFTAISINHLNHKKINHQLFLTLNYLSGRDLAQLMLVNKSFLIDAYKSNLVMPQTIQRHRAFFCKQIELSREEIKQSRALEDYNSTTHPYKMIREWYNVPELSSEKKSLILSRFSLHMVTILVTIVVSSFLIIVSGIFLIHRFRDWKHSCDKDEDESFICALSPLEFVVAVFGWATVNALLAVIILHSVDVINRKGRPIIRDHLKNATLQLEQKIEQKIEHIKHNDLILKNLITPPNGDEALGDSHNDHAPADVSVQVLR